jgi:hypothetical protein
MKRNIFYSVGGGGGIPPASGVGKIKFSPGEFDEDIQGIFEFQGVWRLEKKDIIPVTGYGLFFNSASLEINSVSDIFRSISSCSVLLLIFSQFKNKFYCFVIFDFFRFQVSALFQAFFFSNLGLFFAQIAQRRENKEEHLSL